MGLYARLINTPLVCPKCGVARTDTWQFQFGDVHDLPQYEIGDSIHWDTLHCYGFASMREVYAVAYPEAEVFCHGCTDTILGQVVIIDGKVRSLKFLEFGHHKVELFYVGAEKRPYYIDDKKRGRVTNIRPQGL